MYWDNLKKKILDTDLYSRSGTEVGVSEGTLTLVEQDGDYLTTKTTADDIPEIAYTSSTDLGANYPKLNEFVFGRQPKSWLIGNYEKIFIGHMTDPAIRRNGSSGGIISGTQLYLLRKQKIQGAITLRMRHDKPYLTEPIIATTTEEILEGAQSKYTVAPINQILAHLPGKYSSLSYTGQPEQIASIRKLQLQGHPSVQPITYILGFFYGETLGFGAIKSLLRANHANGVEDIKSLAFRAGEWPGHLQIVLKNNKIITVKKFYANYLSPSHITDYSLYQVDYMAELADISSGDAWAPIYEQRGKGWSVVIARTKKGLELLEEMMAEGVVTLTEISEEELVNMHSLGLDVKKRGAFIRIARRRAKGLPVPEYGYEAINLPFKRQLFEYFFAFTLWVFHRKITLWLLEHIPVPLIGRLFVIARTLWKKTTKSTKTTGISDLQFRLTTAYDSESSTLSPPL